MTGGLFLFDTVLLLLATCVLSASINFGLEKHNKKRLTAIWGPDLRISPREDTVSQSMHWLEGCDEQFSWEAHNNIDEWQVYWWILWWAIKSPVRRYLLTGLNSEMHVWEFPETLLCNKLKKSMQNLTKTMYRVAINLRMQFGNALASLYSQDTADDPVVWRSHLPTTDCSCKFSKAFPLTQVYLNFWTDFSQRKMN